DGLRWPDWEHEHLFSPEWAGDALTLERTSQNAAFVDHLKLYLRPEGEERFTPEIAASWNSGADDEAPG
ncbi:MAG: Imm32 family immunity protein, partial [Pseudomonadota bacterium]|nr:Imm32 family immunity protein [Pseudomonadota bacterium]